MKNYKISKDIEPCIRENVNKKIIYRHINMIRNFISNIQIEMLLETDTLKDYDHQFEIKTEYKFCNLKIYEKFIPIHIEDNYINNNQSDCNKITFIKSLNCSKECAILFLHIVSILEYSFCIKKLKSLEFRMRNFKKFINKQVNRIDYLKNNFEKIQNEQFIDNSLFKDNGIEFEDESLKMISQQFNYKTIYKNHILF